MNVLLTPCQSGFRAFHSTSLLKCTDDWFNGLDARKYAGVVFVDSKKLLIQLIMKSFFKISHVMAFKATNKHGSNHLSNRT